VDEKSFSVVVEYLQSAVIALRWHSLWLVHMMCVCWILYFRKKVHIYIYEHNKKKIEKIREFENKQTNKLGLGYFKLQTLMVIIIITKYKIYAFISML
jgi:hypothetical protein